ncbi:hypothetical protein JCM6882_006227, partial [Rhodosporidiobolus microsporus]
MSSATQPSASTSTDWRAGGVGGLAASTQPNPSRDNAAAAASSANAPARPLPAPVVSLTSVEETVKYILNVRIDSFNLTQPGSVFEAKLATPFPGQRTVKGQVEDDGGFSVGLRIEGAPHGCVGRDLKRSIAFRTASRPGGALLLIQATAENSPIFPNDAHKHFRARMIKSEIEEASKRLTGSLPIPFEVIVTLEGKAPLVEPNRSLAKRAAGLADKPHPHDVCLVFGREYSTSPPLRLWTSRDFLSRSTTYFDAQLVGTVSVAALEPGKRRRVSLADGDNEDSDVETDDNHLTFSSSSIAKDPEPDVLASFTEIQIKDFSYTTYRAVLTYLSTGHITFCPLASSFSPTFPGASKTRLEYLYASEDADADESAFDTGALPLPVSPKSVYALASTLSLPDLQALALAHLKAFLRPETAALELVSPLALSDDAVLDAVVEFVVDHLEEVEKSAAYRRVMDEIKEGEKPKAAGVVVKLWEKQRAKGAGGGEGAKGKGKEGENKGSV